MRVYKVELTAYCGCSITELNTDNKQQTKFCREHSINRETLELYKLKLYKMAERMIGRNNSDI